MKDIKRFIKAQRSIHLYKNVRNALATVLRAMPENDYRKATKNLVLMVLHEGSLGQVMHFPASGKFTVMQLDIPKDIPQPVLEWVIAHEFGHVMQGRNWRKGDGNKLEDDASARAKKWGFPNDSEDKKIDRWLRMHRKRRNDRLHGW